MMEGMLQKIKWEKYPEYKDSGVEWLGEIPAHWEVFPLYAIASLKSIKNKPDLELLSVYLDQGVIRFSDVKEKRTNVTSLDRSNYQLVEPGDFVLNNQQAWRGSVGVSKYKGIVSPAYIVLSLSEKIDPSFANYYFRNGASVGQYLISSKGVGTIQRNLYWPYLRRVYLPLPPLPEQSAIAAFLDAQCAKIDRAIAGKEKLIALLQERKQIMIQQAVTKGLDPEAKMKDSGVEWIGEIPEGWEVKRSKYLFIQRKERAKKDDVQLSATQAYGVIPQDEYEKRSGNRVVKIQFHLDKRKHVEEGDFVISMRSFQGGLERAWTSGCIRSSYIVLKPNQKIDPSFYGYLFKSSKYINALQATANFIRDGQDLNFDNFSRVDLYIVPLKEQKKIVKYLDEKIDFSNKAIEHQQTQIAKLKEYKSILIDAAVTGKIKLGL